MAAGSERRVAVVTPYHREPLELLRRAHESVLAQATSIAPSVRVEHVMVADGHPRPEVDDWDVTHLRLPRAHADNGNTPRSAGARHARAAGAHAVAFLDADNWYLPGHLSGLLALGARTEADLLVSGRIVVAPDGRRLVDAPAASVQAGGHADTSCLLLQRRGLALADLWETIPRPFSALCDVLFAHAIRARGLQIAQSPAQTLAFTSRYAPHFLNSGLTPPDDCRTMVHHHRAATAWSRLPPAQRAALVAGKPAPPLAAAPPRPGVFLLLPQRLQPGFLPLVSALQAAHQARKLTLGRVTPPPSLTVQQYAAALLGQTGPEWRHRVVVLPGALDPVGRDLLAKNTPAQADLWQRPRVILMQPAGSSTPPVERDPALRAAWRVAVPSASAKARFHATCPVGDGHVVDLSAPSAVASLVAEVVSAPEDAAGAAALAASPPRTAAPSGPGPTQ